MMSAPRPALRSDPSAVRGAWLGAAIGTAALVLLAASPAAGSAQELDDGRWLPWIGCWHVADAAGAQNGASGGQTATCVLPAGAGVELVTLIRGEPAAWRTIIADGEIRGLSSPGCQDGWETAWWSSDNRRVYVRSELHCEGTRRATAAVLSMFPDDEWLHVEIVDAGGARAGRVLSHTPAPAPAAFAGRLTGLLEGRALAIETARLAAGRPLSTDDVIEAVDAVGPDAVELLLIHRGEGFALDGAELLRLARAGVPGSVTDLMVALSYPARFAIDAGEITPIVPVAADAPRRPRPGWYDARCIDFAPYGWWGVRPFGWSYGRYGWYGRYSHGFACPGFGVGYWGWAYRPYRPIIIDRGRPSTGRIVQGRGHSRGEGAATAGRAVPRDGAAQPAARDGRRPATGGSRPAVTRDGHRGGSDRSSDRRARPRGNGDPNDRG